MTDHERRQDPLSRTLTGDLPSLGESMALLTRARQGDDEALQHLLVRYQERLRRIVRIQLGSSAFGRAQDSMDLVQNTFLAALPQIRELQPRSQAGLLQWLSLIALNQVRDAWKHQHAGRRDVRREEALPSQADAIAAGESHTVDPGRAVELAEIRDLLDDAVGELPDDQREVVLLRDYYGESWERIAEQMRRERGAARSLHHRAWVQLRSRLRPVLRPSGEEP